MLIVKSATVSILVLLLVTEASSRCVYTQNETFMPYKIEGEAFKRNYTYQVCKDYVEGDVCCNEFNAILTGENLKQVDGAFSSASGGCDICAINLKRFWC